MPRNEDTNMSMVPAPRFDTTINYGHVLTILSLFITLGGGIVYNVREQAVLTHRVAQLELTTKAETARLSAESASRVAQYAPTITALNKSQYLQDERIGNVIEAVKEIRVGLNNLVAMVTDLKQAVAVVRVQMAVPPQPVTTPRVPSEYTVPQRR